MTSSLSIINFYIDIVQFIKLKIKEKNFEIGFFCKNKFILNYLKPYIDNKTKKKKVLIITFENLNSLTKLNVNNVNLNKSAQAHVNLNNSSKLVRTTIV